MYTDKCTKIRPYEPDFKPCFYPNFQGLWINEKARFSDISAYMWMLKIEWFRLKTESNFECSISL
jgi:hypothetical protein